MLKKTINRLTVIYLAAFLFSTNTLWAQLAPHPAQLTATIYQAPTVVLAQDKAYLIYELYLTSFMTKPVTLTSLEVKDGDKLLYTEAKKTKPLHFEPRESKIINLTIPFDSLSAIPDSISNHFVFTGPFENKKTDFPLVLPATIIDKKAALIVGAPLRGGNWIAGNLLAPDTSHRKAALYFEGRPYYPERYAIDFVQTDANDKTFKGDEHKNSSYYCYNQDVLAVGDGKVVAVMDGIPENIPNSGHMAVPMTEKTLAGNYIIIELGNNQYVGYGHLIPGSLKFKVGDEVKRGDVIAKLGNSGNSSEAHLHIQLTDKPSFLQAEGIPYGFDRFRLMNKNATQADFSNQLPFNDDVIGF